MSLLTWLRTLAGAVSHADIGPYAGAPRNPELRVGDEKSYSTIHYATENAVRATASGDCPACGEARLPVGGLATCPRCEPDTWLLRSQMSAVAKARAKARRNVV